ncbi:MAG: OsmC family protein [Acidobacteria bacterium]|nr:OsmC family protein [Acidobacteriota bacterium]
MGRYGATVVWERGAAAFVGGAYSREHRWDFDGGVSVVASASPQIVKLPHSREDAVDPEEAFVAAIASCHMLWFLSIAAERGHIVERYEDAAVGLLAKNAEGKLAMTKVTLRPRVTFAEAATREALEALHHAAHEECFLAKSVTSEVVIEPLYE